MMADYYCVANVDHPTPEMYGVAGWDPLDVLVVGTHAPIDWALTIDTCPDAPATLPGVSLDRACGLFRRAAFHRVILDGVTNFVAPSQLARFVAQAQRLSCCGPPWGRCIVGQPRTLRGPVQRYVHETPPGGVRWIDLWEVSP